MSLSAPSRPDRILHMNVTITCPRSIYRTFERGYETRHERVKWKDRIRNAIG